MPSGFGSCRNPDCHRSRCNGECSGSSYDDDRWLQPPPGFFEARTQAALRADPFRSLAVLEKHHGGDLDALLDADEFGDRFDYARDQETGQMAERGGRFMTVKPAVQNQAPPRESRMKLGAVTKGRVERPMRLLVYGTEGVGKTLFAANAPSPIFIPTEDGTDSFDVPRFPRPQSWAELLDAVDELLNSPHEYKTVVIDTLDAAEPMCWQHIVDNARSPKIKSVEDFGFGKGYVAALDAWRVLLSRLELLRARREMHVLLIAHSWIKPFKNPEDEDYDRYELKLHTKAGGLIKEWADAVLFARFETFTNTDEKSKRSRGVSTGARVIHTQRTAAFDAKNRFDLPPTLPLDWTAFLSAVKAQTPADPAKLKERIATLLINASDDVTERVSIAVDKAGNNAAQLARIADHLAATVSIANQENAQ